MIKKDLTTLSQVMNQLRDKGKDCEFKLADSGLGLINAGNGKLYSISDLRIIRTYRFEGDSNPSDSSILYLIEANDGQVGYVLDAYGAYSGYDDDQFDKLIREIPVAEK
ncbi:MAG: hypothetical protein H7Y31_18355 [Chitinophagaceae bacterium]|nr:hypothetical protein [Chitinophagaceae bacterium]